MTRSVLVTTLAGCTMPIGVGFNPDRLPIDRHPLVDDDGDGWSVTEGDCDDDDASVDPSAYDDCDGRDNDCDGFVDEEGCARYEEFTQSLTSDVLIVVDRSPTMDDYAARVGAAASELLEPLVGEHHDTHVGVITMDAQSDNQGLVRHEGRDWIDGDATTLDVATGWLQVVLWKASDGEATILPEGRAAVREEFFPDLTADRSQGVARAAEFLREDAALHVLFVSDREDMTDLGEYGTIDLIDDLESVSETRHPVIHAIAEDGAVPACGGTVGESYVWMAESTLGKHWSVCEDDYGFLATLAEAAATDGLESRFELDSAPVAGSVVVAVTHVADGAVEVLPEKAFDVDGAALLIRQPWLPEAGDGIRVDYEIDPLVD